MRRIALTLLLAIVTMAGSAPAWAHKTTVQEVSNALAAKTAHLLAALPKRETETESVSRVPAKTRRVETIAACVNRTLAANGLTEVTARHILPGTTIRVETGTASSSIDYRLARGDTVWGSCVKELRAVPATVKRLAQVKRAKALTAVWKSVARPPPLGAVTGVSTALAAETAAAHLLTKKAASLTAALAAETTKNHSLTKKVTQLQTALAAEIATAQLLGRQVAELKRVHKPIDPPTRPATSSEGNQGDWGDLIAQWAIYIGLGGIFLIFAIPFIGAVVRRVKRLLEKKSPLATGVTPITTSRTPVPATPAQESLLKEGSTIRFELNPAWIAGRRKRIPVPIVTTVTKVVHDSRGAPILFKGHAPWDGNSDGVYDDPVDDASIVLASLDSRTGKVTYVTKPLAQQIARALDHRFDRSPTTRKVHAWFHERGLQLCPQRGYAFLWRSLMLRAFAAEAD